MPTTPIHALPYPASSDPVNQGAVNFNALATALDGKLPPKGGASGLFLAKSSGSDYAYTWQAIGGLPAGGTVGQVLTKSGSADYAASWQAPTGGGGGGAQGTELAYAQITSPAVLASGTEGASSSFLVTPSVVYDGSPVLLEFFAPAWQAAANAGGSLVLWDDTANVSLGILTVLRPPTSATDCTLGVQARRFTPAAGARVYSIRGFGSGNTLTIQAGAGGVGNRVPADVRVTKV